MKTIKWIIAAVLLGTMASCSEDSMEIPEEPIKEKMSVTYKGEYNCTPLNNVNYAYYHIKVGSTIEAYDSNNECHYLTDITVTIDEDNHLVFYGFSPGGYRIVFDIRMSENPTWDGYPWGNVYINGDRHKFSLGDKTCND